MILILFYNQEGFSQEQDSQVNESFDIDQLMEEFDEAPSFSEPDKTESPRQTFDHAGFFKLSTTINLGHKAPKGGKTDHRGLSRLRGESHLKCDLRFSKFWKARMSGYARYDLSYSINDRDTYTQDLLDSKESESDLHEIYIQGTMTSQLDIWFGRKIIVWGTSETFRIVDVINPVDYREFGMLDIEELRLPLILTQVNYYAGPWTLSGVMIHENRKRQMPPFGSDYYLADTPMPDELVPSNTIDNTMLAFALTGRFSGWDISFNAAKFNKDTPQLEIMDMGMLTLKQCQLKMVGATIALVYGNWLLKGELAGSDGHMFVNKPDTTFFRLDAMSGFEYSGFKDTSLSFEIMNQHVCQHDIKLLNPPDRTRENTFQSAFRLTKNLFHEKLSVTGLLLLSGTTSQHGSFERLSVEYDWNDAIDITFGFAIYQTGRSYIFKRLQDNDRIFLDIQYNF
ncbi:MAG: SH3 type 3 domain-containing protein [Candidatus Magnetoglobus multicellularis str. Araruama]|uniref:SH3 type 3 domain-containing protein n=1 Tax=Candidatus Magnetoglobus multicellularis str. Araruama TaxID=890399 RepID=A0A1V1P7Y6_9BACT|nr:MAG: SH3 type 3 domain-containing protein [Candidatus Magnetoglobus multicellularis str. Araruama]